MTENARTGELDRQITTLTEIVSALTTTVTELSDRIKHLEATGYEIKAAPAANRPRGYGYLTSRSRPQHPRQSAIHTVDNFVAWCNITYVGV